MPHKLVRDLIPKIIGEREKRKLKIDKDYTKAAPEEIIYHLADKLLEEAKEFRKVVDDYGGHHSEHSDGRRLEELADVYEVVRALALYDGRSMKDVEAAADKKREERGAFEQRFVLVLPMKDHDRSKRDGSVFHERCSVGFDADIQVTTDGRERGLWVWIRYINARDENFESAVLLEWPEISKLHKAVGKARKKE